MTTTTVSGSTLKEHVLAGIEEQSGAFVRLAHDIHAHPELAFAEHRAVAWITDLLDREGFRVQRAAFGLPTAFTASVGHGPLHLAFRAEYGALDDGVGHGCGHNLIAGASVAAAVGLRDVVDEVGLTVSVIGTPGEVLIRFEEPATGHLVEGRVNLLDAGASDDVHAVLMVHPGASPCSELIPICNDPMLAAAYRRNAKLLRMTRDVDMNIRDQIRGHGTMFRRRTTDRTDLGNVSDVIPSVHPMIDLGRTAPTNTAEFAQRADADEAYRAMLNGGIALAWTALDAATDPEVSAHLLERARHRWPS
jgi:hypothetical protein